jgi:hypothetical protein
MRTGAETGADDDFSWENDEEEESSPTPDAPSTSTAAPVDLSTSAATIGTAASEETEAWSPAESRNGGEAPAVSARNSSEEGTTSSYDVVSGPASVTSSEVGTVAAVAAPRRNSKAKADPDSGDESDWE